MLQIASFFAVLALASAGGLAPAYAAGPVAYAQPAVHYAAQPILKQAIVAAPEPFDPNPQYNYGYSVQDGLTGDQKNHQESRNGDLVQGQYSLVEPDGAIRTVTYTADGINGFNAVVDRQAPQVAVAKVHAAPVAVARVAAPVAYSAPVAAYGYQAPAYAAAPALAYNPGPAFAHAAPLAYNAGPAYAAAHLAAPVAYNAGFAAAAPLSVATGYNNRVHSKAFAAPALATYAAHAAPLAAAAPLAYNAGFAAAGPVAYNAGLAYGAAPAFTSYSGKVKSFGK